MTKTDLARTVATIACTIVTSATLLVAAIGPADAGAIAKPPVASARVVA